MLGLLFAFALIAATIAPAFALAIIRDGSPFCRSFWSE